MDAGPVIEERPLTIPARDGHPLAALVLAPPAPRALLILQGGTGIPRGFYLKYARHAAGRGYVVVLFDYRGVGGSRPASLRGFEAYMRWWGERDMPAVLDWAIAEYPALPRAILGHSAGAQLVGLMPNHAEVGAVAAIAAGTGHWRLLQVPYRWFSLLAWYGLAPLFLPAFGYFPARRLGLGEDLPAGVAWEWRDWCLNPPYIGRRLGETMHAPHYDQVRTPIRAWAFTDDPIAHPASTRELMRLYTSAPVTVTPVTPAEAGVRRIGHLDFFRERCRSLWDGPLDWIGSVLGV